MRSPETPYFEIIQPPVTPIYLYEKQILKSFKKHIFSYITRTTFNRGL